MGTDGGGDASAVAKSPARVTDTVTAELSGPERTPPKGPDPAEWGEAQLVPPDDGTIRDYEIKGPDPEKWPDATGTGALSTQVGIELDIAAPPTTASTNIGIRNEASVEAVPDVVLGTVEPPT